MKNNKQKFVFKQVYLLSLVPVLSVFLYLGMMAGGLVEGVYLWTVIALAAMSVTGFEVIAFSELGCESVKRVEIKDFSLICAIDCKGGNIFDKGESKNEN
jgi:hypothetical protein